MTLVHLTCDHKPFMKCRQSLIYIKLNLQVNFKIVLCTVLRSIECIWLSEEHAWTLLLDYFYFVVFVSLFLSLISIILFCLFVPRPFPCVSFSLLATGF